MDHRVPGIIPLFPLSRILFPKMLLPLHIFEEKYKLMISRCLDEEALFGVVSHQDPREGSVGTTAEVHQVLKEQEDGSSDILVLGHSRFKLKRIITEELYLQGEVEYFDDDSSLPVNPGEIERMIKLYKGFIARLGLKQRQKEDLASIVQKLSSEMEISYIIAQTIGLDTSQQEALLAETSPASRIGWITDELIRHNSLHKVARNLFEDSEFDPNQN